jgi:hypothetical protein
MRFRGAGAGQRAEADGGLQVKEVGLLDFCAGDRGGNRL